MSPGAFDASKLREALHDVVSMARDMSDEGGFELSDHKAVENAMVCITNLVNDPDAPSPVPPAGGGEDASFSKTFDRAHEAVQWLYFSVRGQLTRNDWEERSNALLAAITLGRNLITASQATREAVIEECAQLAFDQTADWGEDEDGWNDACRHIEKTIRALKQEPASDGWLPIDSAPRDGTWFLACATEPGWRATRIVRFAAPDDRLPINGEGGVWPSVPTHWRPLPAPPHALKQGGQE